MYSYNLIFHHVPSHTIISTSHHSKIIIMERETNHLHCDFYFLFFILFVDISLYVYYHAPTTPSSVYRFFLFVFRLTCPPHHSFNSFHFTARLHSYVVINATAPNSIIPFTRRNAYTFVCFLPFQVRKKQP